MSSDQEVKQSPALHFEYRNWKGVVAKRSVIPVSVEYMNSTYHGVGWVLKAWDIDKQDVREFSLKDIINFNEVA